MGTEHLPLGSTRAVEQQFSTTQGEEGLKFTFDLMGIITGALIRPVEAVLASEGVDGVVFDTYQPYMELSAIALGLPYIHVANAVAFDVSGETPLCFFDWDFSGSGESIKRNLEGVEVFRRLLEPSIQAAKQYAFERQIAVDWNDLTATRSKLGWITQLPRDFEFGTEGGDDETLSHTGPFVNERLRPSVVFPWADLAANPLVYASMGTLQNGIEAVFQNIIDAAKHLKHLQFLISVGDKLDQALFHPLPKNVLMVSVAPQLELLKRASLCITHAGLNTVLEALSYGVPLVALPVTNDQPGVAARIRGKEFKFIATTRSRYAVPLLDAAFQLQYFQASQLEWRGDAPSKPTLMGLLQALEKNKVIRVYRASAGRRSSIWWLPELSALLEKRT